MAVLLSRMHIKRADWVMFGLLVASAAIGFLYILVNALTTQYSGNLFLPTPWIYSSPMGLILTLVGIEMRSTMPRTGILLRAIGFFFLIAVVENASLAYGVQFTPFSTVDTSIAAFDRLLGFDVVTAMDWTNARPLVHRVFSIGYESLVYQLLAVPILLTLAQRHKAVDDLFISIMISFVIGTAIYYFFPTLAPAGVIQDPHFTAYQHDTSLKFNEIHHHLPITRQAGGLIGFPSFHVVWAVLLAYACRSVR